MVFILRRRNGVPSSAGVVQVTLADATNTYGIKRNDNGATVLAAGAATTNPSAGRYEYNETPLALDPAFTYSAVFKVVDDKPQPTYVTRTINGLDQTHTLRGLRRALSTLVGRHQVVTTTAADASADALRTMIIDELVDYGAQTSKYKGVYFYIADGALAGQQRRAMNTGFTQTTGSILVRRPYASIPQSGVSVEMHAKLPAFTADGIRGLNECINAALKVTYHPVRLEFVATSGQQNAPLSTKPWLTDEDQIGVEFEPQPNSAINPLVRPDGVRFRADADNPQLEIDWPWNTGDTYWVEAMRPNFSFVKRGNAWQEVVDGLTSDDDETLGDPLLVIEVALAYAYRALMVAGAEADGEAWEAKYMKQVKHALVVRESRQNKLLATGLAGAQRSPGAAQGLLLNRSGSRSSWS